MTVSAQMVAELMAAGLEGEALIAALRRIEEASQTSHETSQKSAGAKRTERWREKRKASHVTSLPVTETSQGVTERHYPTYNTSSNSRDTETDSKVGSRHTKSPKRIVYPALYEKFWDAYPADKLMSKSEGLAEWIKLPLEDQELAIAALPAFKTETAKLGPDHRIIDACRYLKKRRFDAFKVTEQQAKALDLAASKTYVKYGTDAGDAWEASYRLKGKVPPRDQAGGWWFPSEYPEQHAAA